MFAGDCKMTEVENKGNGKAKDVLTVFIVLTIVLTASVILVFVTLKNQINDLEIENTTMNGQMGNLQTEKSSLQKQVSNLHVEKSKLQSQVSLMEAWLEGNKTQLQSATNERKLLQTWLDSNVTNYESQVGNLNSQIISLEAQITSLQDEMALLEDEVDWLHSLISGYDQEIFFFYYVKPEEQKFGVYDLEDELYGLEWIEPYQEGVFDCSEMSAYLEWHLENEGWNTVIVAGDSPFGSGKHAWLLVETSTDHYMPVESTNIEVVWWEDPYFDNYWTYDYVFETILDALAYSETEFDWWN